MSPGDDEVRMKHSILNAHFFIKQCLTVIERWLVQTLGIGFKIIVLLLDYSIFIPFSLKKSFSNCLINFIDPIEKWLVHISRQHIYLISLECV
jgi:hypothetical protein